MVTIDIPIKDPTMFLHAGAEKVEVINEDGVLLLYNNPSSRKITLSKNVRVISSTAFEKCKRIADVYIPDTVEKIEEGAFNDCSNLQIISVDNDTVVENGYESVFKGCGYVTLNIRFKDYTQAILRRIF